MTTMTSPPTTAAELINTFGVNYCPNVDDATSQMRYLGITNMRLFTDYYPWNDLAMAQNGIKFDFVLAQGGNITTSDLQTVVSRRHFFSVAPDWHPVTGTTIAALGDLSGFVGEQR